MQLEIPTSTLGIKYTRKIEVVGLDGVSIEGLFDECSRGATFRMYAYTVSVLVMTFKRNSPIYFVRPAEDRLRPGWKFTVVNMMLGWWGIPWGPIYTIGSLVQNLNGGKDVTDAVLAYVNAVVIGSQPRATSA